MPDSASPPDRLRRAVRLVAFVEAAKGALVLLAGTGMLTMLHKDVYELALKLVMHAHLNPAAHYPQIFLAAAANTGDSRLLVLALGALGYALIRFAEAYGLFYERTWAELLAAVSGAVYIPFEVLGLVRHPSRHGLILIVLNILIVAIMVSAMRRRHAFAPKPLSGEEEARIALLQLHDFLAAIPESSPDYRNAQDGAALLAPFLSDPMDAAFYHALCGMLSKGLGDWAWTVEARRGLEPLMNNAADKTHRHVMGMTAAKAL